MNSSTSDSLIAPVLPFTSGQAFCTCGHTNCHTNIQCLVTKYLVIQGLLQNIPQTSTTLLYFLSSGSNTTEIIQSWKYSMNINTFSSLLINNVHFMCTIDFSVLLYLSDPQWPAGGTNSRDASYRLSG